jgi:NADPH:quinone reductase-like Zn-dependent oxidoreductase
MHFGWLKKSAGEPKHGEVRVRVLAAGVSLPDLMMREGIHPETPRLPFTPGWDLIGVVDRRGANISGIEPGQIIAALPISGAYAEFVCLPQPGSRPGYSEACSARSRA